MSMNKHQQAATALGIIPWQRRGLAPVAAPTRIKVLIAVPAEDEHHPLLQTMLASFHMPESERQVTVLNDQLNEMIEMLQPEHLLILGDGKHLETSVPTTVTHSLAQLVQQPALKRETYVALKALGLYA